MKWHRLFTLLLIGAVAGSGCSSDGGSSGTGITTALGNVVAVTSLAAGRTHGAGLAMGVGDAMGTGVLAQGDVGGIRVSIDGTDIATETDANGAFRLRGAFDSFVTLLFTRSSDGLVAKTVLNAPAGGTLTLEDVSIDAATQTATAVRQGVVFAALVTTTQCAAGTITLVSQQSPSDGDDYLVELAGSTIVDGQGDPVPCTSLKPDDALDVSGIVNPDGTFGDARMVLTGTP